MSGHGKAKEIAGLRGELDAIMRTDGVRHCAPLRFSRRRRLSFPERSCGRPLCGFEDRAVDRLLMADCGSFANWRFRAGHALQGIYADRRRTRRPEPIFDIYSCATVPGQCPKTWVAVPESWGTPS
jgi:hypothetical protein